MEYPMKANPKIRFRRSERGGWEYNENGTWYFTQRTTEEIRQICDLPPEQEKDLEIWGDTLDEPLPDDLIDMLES